MSSDVSFSYRSISSVIVRKKKRHKKQRDHDHKSPSRKNTFMSVRNVLYHHHYYLSFNQQNLPFFVITVDIHHFHFFAFLSSRENQTKRGEFQSNTTREINVYIDAIIIHRTLFFLPPSFLIDMCQAVVYVYSHENSKHDHHLSHIQICSSLFLLSFLCFICREKKAKERFHTFDR